MVIKDRLSPAQPRFWTKGEILARMETTGIGIETREIDPSLALDKSVSSLNSVFADRRPDFYER